MSNTLVNNKRIEYAPDRFVRNYGTAGPLSVNLNPDEDVIWTYQYDLNGNKFVSGYTIIKKVRYE